VGIGDWGLGIGDWGLGIGEWAQSPIPKYYFSLKIKIRYNNKYKYLKYIFNPI